MTSGLFTRRIAVAAAGAALAAMAALTACSPTTEKEAPSSSTTPAPSATSAPASTSTNLTPSEKAVGPGMTNSFSPTVTARQPGAVCQQLVNGVCVR